ncbi:hypothetical protein ACFWBR_39435 [Streptomyces sp. NPDC060006]|uniref:aromatic-ring hydroxylase C-terminal domain-containing protein n=1 Tax=unclassified Streptomyces TaxID=2593676 RepID=UPI0036B385AB
MHAGRDVLLTVKSPFVGPLVRPRRRGSAAGDPAPGQEGRRALLIRPDGHACWTAPAASDVETVLTTRISNFENGF